MNEIAYRNPRNRAQAVSPTATSAGPIGVESTASYVLAYFSFQKTFVES
jgi:hypothetical protein